MRRQLADGSQSEATMTTNELQSLFLRPPRQHASVLTVYLNVDQSSQPNLNRGFETQLSGIMLGVRKTISDSSELAQFDAAEQQIAEFVSHYHPRSSGLAMFVDTSDEFFWHRDIDFPVRNEARWDREFFAQPLANAMDQLETYGVVLMDRENLRLFLVSLGKIEECVHRAFEGRTRHIKTSGTDHIGSASQIQRKADVQVRANLRRSIMFVEDFIQKYHVARLVLAGRPEIIGELGELLPKRLVSRLIGTASLSAGAPKQEVLAATQPVAEAYERATEVGIVRELLTAAAKGNKAVIGLDRTLKALNSNRVWQFVYSYGYSAAGFACSQCAALSASDTAQCPQCKGSVTAIADVVEPAVQQALRRGAKMEVVTGEAAVLLNEAGGGIGALLKRRTGKGSGSI